MSRALRVVGTLAVRLVAAVLDLLSDLRRAPRSSNNIDAQKDDVLDALLDDDGMDATGL